MNPILDKIQNLTKPLNGFLNNEYDEINDAKTDDLIELFIRELNRVSGSAFYCKNIDEILSQILKIISEKNVTKIVLNSDLFKLSEYSKFKDLKTKYSQIEFHSIDEFNTLEEFKDSLASSDLSISMADYLIAETGTISIFAKKEESRLLSVLSPINIVIAKKENILPSFGSLLKTINDKYNVKIPLSAIYCITGPSRTADIEKILIIGVHGPKELFVLIY